LDWESIINPCHNTAAWSGSKVSNRVRIIVCAGFVDDLSQDKSGFFGSSDRPKITEILVHVFGWLIAINALLYFIPRV
jgi:hypothetical protein